jgi:hypothetical protein
MGVLLRIACGVVGATALGLGLAFNKRIENTYLRMACMALCTVVYLYGIGFVFRKRNRGESNHQVDNS